MKGLISTNLDKPGLGRALAADDVAYFKAAANNIHCLGGVLSQVTGFPGLPLACVLHSMTAVDDINTWIPEVEKCFAARGAHWVRFYLQQVSNSQREQLQLHDYRESLEVGFATRLDDISCEDLKLQHCCNEQQWQEYTKLCRVSGVGPDGHDMVGDSYARVSRRK